MPNKDVFEESTLTIGTQLVGTVTTGKGKAKLILVIDGKDQSPKALDVDSARIETQHTFAKVDDAKESYQLAYKIQYRSQSVRGDNSYTVWPKNSKVKLLGPDGAAVPTASFALVYEDGSKTTHETLDDGTCDCQLTKKSRLTVGDSGTTVVDRPVDGKGVGRDRQIKVTTKQYKIAAPAHTTKGEEISQYVNLPSANPVGTAGQDKLGRVVVVQVEAKTGTGAQDEKVFVKATFGRETKRTAEAPKLVDVQGLDATDPKKPKGHVLLGGDGKATFKVDLGLGGGETCLLEVGGTDECKDGSIKLVNRRRLFYQMSKPHSSAAPAFGVADGALDKVKVEIERYATKDTAANEGALPAGSWIDLGAGSKLVLGTHNTAAINAMFNDTKTPQGFHVIFCDLQYDGVDGHGANYFKTVNYSGDPGDTTTWPPTGAVVAGFHATPVNANDGGILGVACQTGGAGVTGTWKKQIGAVWTDQGAIPGANIHVAPANRVHIMCTDEMKAVIDGGQQFKVALDVFYATGPYNGWSTGKHVVIALANSSGARDATGMNKTIVHEIGHMMNQSGESTVAGLVVAVDHGKTYTDSREPSHLGGHCAFGIDDAIFNDGAQRLKGRASATCVMYGEGSTTKLPDFCAKCAPFVVAEPLDRVNG